MRTAMLFLVKLLVTLLVIGVIVYTVVKYLDVIIGFCVKIKRTIAGFAAGRNRDSAEENDIDLSEICLDLDCACQGAE